MAFQLLFSSIPYSYCPCIGYLVKPNRLLTALKHLVLITSHPLQIHELASTGELVCWKYFTTQKKNHFAAASHCLSLGSYLVNVQTTARLQLIRALVTQGDAWIGLDDLVTEGVYIWTIGGDTLTAQEITDHFKPGEPNNWHDIEDCGEYHMEHITLNDDSCVLLADYVCEKILPSLGS